MARRKILQNRYLSNPSCKWWKLWSWNKIPTPALQSSLVFYNYLFTYHLFGKYCLSSLSAGYHFRIPGNKNELMFLFSFSFLVLRDLASSLEGLVNRVISFTLLVIIGVCTGFNRKTQKRHLRGRVLETGEARQAKRRRVMLARGQPGTAEQQGCFSEGCRRELLRWHLVCSEGLVYMAQEFGFYCEGNHI